MPSERLNRGQRKLVFGFCTLCLSACGEAGASTDMRDAGRLDAPQDAAALSASDAMLPLPKIQPAANDSRIHSPADATPSPDGARVYYTAFARDEAGDDSAGVFATSSEPGGEIETLALGAPLAYPLSIATSLDGQRLFVADRAAGEAAAGAVLGLDSVGGSPTILEGTADYRPGGLTVYRGDGSEQVLFSGYSPDTGRPGVFSVAASGGTVQRVADGELFHEPSGVVAAADGSLFVVDIADHAARVLRIQGGQTELLVGPIGVGFPAGIALTRDERSLLVSGIDPVTRHDVVYVVNRANAALSQWTEVVGQFAEAAGLHRAHDADVFAWADSQANQSGTVYVLKP